jgi:predicted hydrocarbon binding protein
MSNEPLTSSQLQGTRNPSIILLRRESFEKMLSAFTETYGTPGYSMIYSMGKDVGVEEFKNIAEELKTLNIPMTRPKILKKVLERFTSMGWGNFQAESLELDISSIIVVTNNMFSDKCSHTSVGCCFIQGIIAGLMSQVFESEPQYTEPRCLAQPGGRCLFRLKSENARSKVADPSTVS